MRVFTLIFAWMTMFATSAFATDAPEAFYNALKDQTTSYIAPAILLIVIIATAITYMKTKDWTVSLVTGGISAAIIGGAASLVDGFTSFTFG